MRLAFTLTALACTAISGCMSTNPDLSSLSALEYDEYRAAHEYLLADLLNEQSDEAIRVQRTIFPYHFASGSPRINELGEKDLTTLAAMYRQLPGDLNVRMGDATPELYESRVGTVLQFLQNKGVHVEGMRIVDGRMGGEGMWSVRAIQAELGGGEESGGDKFGPAMSEGISK